MRFIYLIVLLIPLSLNAGIPYRGEFVPNLCGKPSPDLKICLGVTHNTSREYIAVLKIRDEHIVEKYFFKANIRSRSENGNLLTIYESSPEMDCLLSESSKILAMESQYKVVVTTKGGAIPTAEFLKEVGDSYRTVGKSFDLYTAADSELLRP